MSYSKVYAIDADVGLIKRAPAQAAVTSTAYIGTQLDMLASQANDMLCVINLEAVNVAAGSIYTWRIVGANAANRSDAEVLATAQCGQASTITIETRDSAAGDRIVIPFRTEKNRTRSRYVDLHLTVAGGSATITFNAYFTKEV